MRLRRETGDFSIKFKSTDENEFGAEEVAIRPGLKAEELIGLFVECPMFNDTTYAGTIVSQVVACYVTPSGSIDMAIPNESDDFTHLNYNPETGIVQRRSLG